MMLTMLRSLRIQKMRVEMVEKSFFEKDSLDCLRLARIFGVQVLAGLVEEGCS